MWQETTKERKLWYIVLQGHKKSSCRWLEDLQAGTRRPRELLGFFGGARALLHLFCAAVWNTCSLAQ